MALPPPDRPGRGKGRRTVHGDVPPLPAPSPSPRLTLDDIARLTDPEPHDRDDDGVEIPPPPPPDPSRLTGREADEFQAILGELASREMEALALFEPMPIQEEFLSSEAAERIVIGGNRGGKTLITAVEFARAVTGQDPHDKYPRKLGRAIVCGRDLIHCSKVVYRKLFKPGAFKIIRDEESGAWRAYRPGDPRDAARAEEAVDAPPLVPERFYDRKRISWEDKKEEIPKTIILHNGWEITFFSSIGDPPQGWDVDLVLFDEEIESPKWYPEMAARLLDRRKQQHGTGKIRGGKFIWSATPQAGTQRLYDLKCRADELANDPNASIKVFTLTLLNNVHMTEAAKAEFISKITDEDEYRIRVLGDFSLLGSRVYPEFQPKGVHGWRDVEGQLASFPIPDIWCRYAFIDPGRQVCAVLFCAVPPKTSEHFGRKFIYDELYLKKCDAVKFAQAMHLKTANAPIHRWYIDHRAGRATEIGSGKTPEEQYSAALKAMQVSCEATGHKFTWASDDVQGGISAVRTGLRVVDGRSEWVIFTHNCPNLVWEITNYSYRKLPNGLVTDEPLKYNDHLADCWRYAAMANLKYVASKIKKRVLGYTCEALKKKRERAARRDKESGWGGSIKLG